MSIKGELRTLCEGGRLIPIRPQIGDGPDGRCLFVSELVWGAINPPYNTKEDEIRMGSTVAMLDAFVEGKRISVRFPPSKKVSANIALLDRPEEEIWEIRVRDPRPGVRILGRFACTDVFVGLLPIYREDLTCPDVPKGALRDKKEQKKWSDAKSRCCTEWERLFQQISPHKGDLPNDYISNNIYIS